MHVVRVAARTTATPHMHAQFRSFPTSNEEQAHHAPPDYSITRGKLVPRALLNRRSPGWEMATPGSSTGDAQALVTVSRATADELAKLNLADSAIDEVRMVDTQTPLPGPLVPPPDLDTSFAASRRALASALQAHHAIIAGHSSTRSNRLPAYPHFKSQAPKTAEASAPGSTTVTGGAPASVTAIPATVDELDKLYPPGSDLSLIAGGSDEVRSGP